MGEDGDSPDAPALLARLRLVRAAVFALLLILVAGLAYQQIGRAADHSAQERRQTQRRLLQPAPRGQLFDREHRLLAGTRMRTTAVIDLGKLRAAFAAEQRLLASTTAGAGDLRPPAARARIAVVRRELERLLPLLDRPRDIDPDLLERHFAYERIFPFVLIDSLAPQEARRLAAALPADDPVRLEQIPERWHPRGRLAAHALGRVRKDRIQPAPAGLVRAVAADGLAGDFGIEKQFDLRLRGAPAETLIRVDAGGFPVAEPLAKTSGIAGEDLVLSIDLDLQQAAEDAMDAIAGASRGAAVAIEVATGEILVLASRPDFDLNAVSPTIAAAMKDRLDASGAWLNRATQALYPPGSSHKIFTALAGLRHGSLHPGTAHRCDGFLQVGGRRFPCHHAEGHGENTLRRALAQSCNVFAYRTGLDAGVAALAAEARRFHFDTPTGVDLPGETTRMLVPDPAWKKAEARGEWTPGDTANLAIGQGFLRYSPLQVACAMASLARRETLTVPTLLHQPGRSPTGDRPREPLAVSEENYAALLAALEAVVQTGIGQNAQVPGVRIAGKTGTAQIVRPEGMMNVAWFIAFAPAENPEIALAVALEGDTPDVEFAGAAHATPVAREIMGTYFDKRAAQRRALAGISLAQ